MEIVYDNIVSLTRLLLRIILLLQLIIMLLNKCSLFSTLVFLDGLKAACEEPEDCELLRKYRGEAFTETAYIEKGVAYY